MQLLGDTISKIAFEKAGIIKSGIPVAIGERQADADIVFLQKAKEEHAPIQFASDTLRAHLVRRDKNFSYFNIYSNKEILFEEIALSLQGNYQRKNICTVLSAITQLQQSGYNISQNAIRSALMNVQGMTGLAGRWQILQERPTIICDVGHNHAGVEFILEQLKEYSYDTLRMVIGVVNDKDVNGLLSQLPKNAVYYFCKANIPRALDAELLQKSAAEFGLDGANYPSVAAAIQQAKADSSENDLIFIGGSTFVVAEI
jgi:dihydrofolate synthase/folylpolyglutamate synthase